LAGAKESAYTLLVCVLAELLQMIDVAPCRKPAALAGHDQYANIIVSRSNFKRLQKVLTHRAAKRV